MKRYRVEIFTNKFEFIDFALLESAEILYDYITLEKSTFVIPKKIDVSIGNFIRVKGDEFTYEGIITDYNFNKSRVVINAKPLLNIFDTNVYFDQSLLLSDSLENVIKGCLITTYSGSDTTQNIYGLEVNVESSTNNAVINIDKSVVNLYTVITEALSKYDIIISTSFNVTTKKFIVTIKKLNLVNIKKIETKYADVLNVEIEYNTLNSKYNKIIYFNEENMSETIIYYYHTDNTVSIDSTVKRFSPVIQDVRIIKVEQGNTFQQTAYDDALNEMITNKYDNKIEIIYNSSSKLNEVGEIGQLYSVIHDGVFYTSLLTGYEKLNEKQTLLKLGTVRTELTQILNIERKRK